MFMCVNVIACIDSCVHRMEDGACIVEFGDNIVFNVTVTLESCDDPSVRLVIRIHAQLRSVMTIRVMINYRSYF